MNARRIATSLALATTLLGLHASGLAATQDDPYPRLFKMEMMDKNKDGMVSKAEFMAMVSKAYDMQAKEMGIKNGKMTESQIEELSRKVFFTR